MGCKMSFCNLEQCFGILEWCCCFKSNSNGSCQKRGVKCHFATLNRVLTSMNNVFASMVGVKMRCNFNNSMFFY